MFACLCDDLSLTESLNFVQYGVSYNRAFGKNTSWIAQQYFCRWNGKCTFVCDKWRSSLKKPPQWPGQGPRWVPLQTARLPPKPSTQRHGHNNLFPCQDVTINNGSMSVKIIVDSSQVISVKVEEEGNLSDVLPVLYWLIGWNCVFK